VSAYGIVIPLDTW